MAPSMRISPIPPPTAIPMMAVVLNSGEELSSSELPLSSAAEEDDDEGLSLEEGDGTEVTGSAMNSEVVGADVVNDA